MAIMDKLNEFADAASVAMAAGTANLTNQIDTSVVRDIGNGEPLYLVISVATGIATGGSAGTIQFALVSDDTASIATNGTQTTHILTKAFATSGTAIAAGTVLACVPLPLGVAAAYERYMGVQVIVGTTTTTAGAVDAYLTPSPVGGWKAYADATN